MNLAYIQTDNFQEYEAVELEFDERPICYTCNKAITKGEVHRVQTRDDEIPTFSGKPRYLCQYDSGNYPQPTRLVPEIRRVTNTCK